MKSPGFGVSVRGHDDQGAEGASIEEPKAPSGVRSVMLSLGLGLGLKTKFFGLGLGLGLEPCGLVNNVIPANF